MGRLDGLAASALAAGLVAQAWVGAGLSTHQRVVDAITSIVVVLPLAFRRRQPALALLSCALVIDAQQLAGGQFLSGEVPTDVGPLILLLALGYGAGAWLGSRPAVLSAVAATLLVAAIAILPGAGPSASSPADVASAIFYSALTILPGWFIGRLAREHARRGQAFRDLASRMAIERTTRDEAAIFSERVRIGSELQDIIATSLTNMVVLAGGARMMLRRDADQARQSIIEIEQTGRQALTDLRQLLGMLRKDGDPAALTPQPGLAQVPALIESVRRSGLNCSLKSAGDQPHLSPGVDLVAYRFVEAALHAFEPGQSSVELWFTTNSLRIRVWGGGHVKTVEADLQPITERVSLYDGRVRVRQDDSRVTAETALPLNATSVP